MSGRLSEAVAARLERWATDRFAERLWARDGSLWADSGHPADEVASWLGWLDLPQRMAERLPDLLHLAGDIERDGYRRAAVLGMGGSSLAPEMFARLFPGAVDLRVLDSTHPDHVRGFRSWAGAARTTLCVSSKSGTTTEPLAFQAALAEIAPALDFVAVTDPGTPLADLARSQGFRAIVEGLPDVGGRFSALSPFGLLPAALHGVDVGGVLAGAARMAADCRLPAPHNPGLQLGALLGEAALIGRDKLTIITTPRLAGLGDWVEQLVAESSGKQGRGIVPIVAESIADPASYADDRCFVVISLAGDEGALPSGLVSDLVARGHPVEVHEMADALDIGAELFRWEVAIAAAGAVLAVNPFDQPDVAAAKAATEGLLARFRADGALPAPAPVVAEPGLAAFADEAVLGDAPLSVEGALRSLLGQATAGDYLAVLAYLPPDPDLRQVLEAHRAHLAARLGVATTLGFGPRYLHSTGQLHKGGPDSGLFLMLTAEPSRDLPIPGREESFGTLVAAQALGDLAALQALHRRVLRLHLAELRAGLARVGSLIDAALGSGVAH